MARVREQIVNLVAELFPQKSWAQFALVAMLAGVGEELLFRGVLQTMFAEWTNVVFGLAAASLLFGLAHAMSRLYFLLATMIGIYLGGLLLWYNDLIAPMVAHALYDFIALACLSRQRGAERHSSGGGNEGQDANEL